MTPKEAAARLNENMSEKDIAVLVDSTQPTIHKIIHHKGHQPFWPLGSRLIEAFRKDQGIKSLEDLVKDSAESIQDQCKRARVKASQCSPGTRVVTLNALRKIIDKATKGEAP